MRMTVFGLGYLGATHAACMAAMGHEVLGVDIDQKKVDTLARGELPFYEPGLDSVLTQALDSGKLQVTTDVSEAASFAHVHFLGVGTPQKKNGYAADTSAVEAVVASLSEHITGSHLLIGKSTVPVGTAQRLQDQAESIIAGREETPLKDASLTVCWNPEFLREGHAVDDTLHPDRIVIGIPGYGDSLTRSSTGAGHDSSTQAGHDSSTGGEKMDIEGIIRDIYEQPLKEGTPLMVMNMPTAELVKVSANAFLATKISFINAVGEVCSAAGADVTQLAQALGADDRIGPKFLGAGLGFGGGCLPKDIRAFMARAGELGADQALTFLREVDAINMRRREKLVEQSKAVFGGSVLGHRVTVLGAAFKPNSDDVRDSPALSVAGALSLAGAQVTVYDPQAMDNAAAVFPTLNYAENVEKAVVGAELVVVATEWQQFRDLDPQQVRQWVREGSEGKKEVIIDGRHCLDPEQWIAAGWEYQPLR